MTQTFEEFLADWRRQSLPAVKGKEFDAAIEKRARELTELAVTKGFRSQLSSAARPYRSTRQFVRALYDATEHHGRNHNDKDGS